MRDRDHGLALGLVMSLAAGAVLLTDVRTAAACGCLSPPAVEEGEFAVNQRAEQIIFEVEPGWVTAHVLIKYAGDPAKFAWIVPVPEVPELAISPLSAFGMLDRATAPAVSVDVENICPVSEYTCRHADSSCDDGSAHPSLPDAGASSDAGGGPPPVQVIDTQVVGDYQTVTFRASEAQAATQWLRDNGFVVNNTTSIYMESYVQANMVFVAAKLVPGAGASSIKPLRMRYRAANPQVPLVLTAVAAEPHLTVTSYVYSQQPFKPQGHPVVTIDPERIAQDAAGRTNYPMVLARTVDEAGGDGFVIEYRGAGVEPQFDDPSMPCCSGELDFCGVANDNQCQCPRGELDLEDCSKTGDIVDGVKLLDALAAKYPRLTRITTRVSAEEMTFDPAFEADFSNPANSRLALRGKQPSLAQCDEAVIDKPRYDEVTALQTCATLYCGAGECMTTESGAGCACDAGFVAQRFIDLDGLPSVTCVPQTPPCDLRAGGDDLPDACASVDCGAGVCIDRNGVAVCACNSGAAAIAGTGDAPICAAAVHASRTPGAQDYSEPLRELEVCAPAPPSCGEYGWLEKRTSPRPGVACANTPQPSGMDLIPKADKRCGGAFGCGGCSAPDGALGGVVGAMWVVFALLLRRRRAR